MIKRLFASPEFPFVYVCWSGKTENLTKSTNKFFNPPLSRHKNTILSAPKAPAGRFSNPQNTILSAQKGPCGTTFCHSQNEIYDIGTEIPCKTCLGHNSTQNERTKINDFGANLHIILRRFWICYQNKIWSTFENLTCLDSLLSSFIMHNI